MFNWECSDEKPATGVPEKVSPADFEIGSLESRAVARLRAKQLEDQCECVRAVPTQLIEDRELAARLKALLERDKRGEPLSAAERELVRRNSLPLITCEMHRAQRGGNRT